MTTVLLLSFVDALALTIDPNTTMTLASLYTTIRHYLVVEHHYSTSLTDLSVAWSMTQRQECVCVLLGGTSGCGKSTLASLLAHRMGITTVLSTDHVRSLLRSFDPEKTQPILWASSYQATVPTKEEDATNGDNEEPTTTINNPTTVTNQVIQGYETQNQLLLATLDKMIYGFYQRKESLVIEVGTKEKQWLCKDTNMAEKRGLLCP
jgi:2-phosphoglycerate kinase